VEKRPEIVPLARPIDWQIARKRSLIKALAEGAHLHYGKSAQALLYLVRFKARMAWLGLEVWRCRQEFGFDRLETGFWERGWFFHHR
jgi:hypothetical protein